MKHQSTPKAQQSKNNARSKLESQFDLLMGDPRFPAASSDLTARLSALEPPSSRPSSAVNAVPAASSSSLAVLDVGIKNVDDAQVSSSPSHTRASTAIRTLALPRPHSERHPGRVLKTDTLITTRTHKVDAFLASQSSSPPTDLPSTSGISSTDTDQSRLEAALLAYESAVPHAPRSLIDSPIDIYLPQQTAPGPSSSIPNLSTRLSRAHGPGGPLRNKFNLERTDDEAALLIARLQDELSIEANVRNREPQLPSTGDRPGGADSDNASDVLGESAQARLRAIKAFKPGGTGPAMDSTDSSTAPLGLGRPPAREDDGLEELKRSAYKRDKVAARERRSARANRDGDGDSDSETEEEEDDTESSDPEDSAQGSDDDR